jgi:hypothetical protein
MIAKSLAHEHHRTTEIKHKPIPVPGICKPDRLKYKHKIETCSHKDELGGELRDNNAHLR